MQMPKDPIKASLSYNLFIMAKRINDLMKIQDPNSISTLIAQHTILHSTYLYHIQPGMIYDLIWRFLNMKTDNRWHFLCKPQTASSCKWQYCHLSFHSGLRLYLWPFCLYVCIFIPAEIEPYFMSIFNKGIQ